MSFCWRRCGSESALRSYGDDRVSMFPGTIVAENSRRGWRLNSGLGHFAAPELKYFARVGQAAAAKAAAADGHHALTDQRVGQRFVVTRPIGLKANPAGVRAAIPILEGHLG